jgi:flagellar hook-basal body complex protein FliE
MTAIGKLPPISGLAELEAPRGPGAARGGGREFSATLREAIESVDRLQHESETAQAAFARGDEGDLHDVLIKVEQAEVAFKTMMEIRNKLVDAYREIMRMGA